MWLTLISPRRLDHIKQGQFTVAVAEDEEPMAPKFLTDIQDAEVPGLSVLTLTSDALIRVKRSDAILRDLCCRSLWLRESQQCLSVGSSQNMI